MKPSEFVSAACLYSNKSCIRWFQHVSTCKTYQNIISPRAENLFKTLRENNTANFCCFQLLVNKTTGFPSSPSSAWPGHWLLLGGWSQGARRSFSREETRECGRMGQCINVFNKLLPRSIHVNSIKRTSMHTFKCCPSDELSPSSMIFCTAVCHPFHLLMLQYDLSGRSWPRNPEDLSQTRYIQTWSRSQKGHP